MYKTIKNRKPSRLAETQIVNNCSVEPNAAYTPSEMQKLASQGIPVSAAAVNENLFFDGDLRAPDTPPIENRRGIDVVEVWEAQRDSRKKILRANVTELNHIDNNSL